jgi:LysR family hydrogen peroxide-inducible transcriptional activator
MSNSDSLPRGALPTLRQLQFLAALQAHGAFVRAADAVGVTQPTLSAGIKELEAVLGATLVDRARGAALTPAGEEAARRAVRVLSETEELVRALRGAAGPLVGAFRLGAIPTIAPFLLPRALPHLRALYPELRLLLREDVSSRLMEQLRARALDAAIIATPYEATGIEIEPIADDEFLLAAPVDHPLAARNDLDPEDLLEEEVLLLEDGHCLRDHALRLCGAPPGRQTADVSATSLYTLVQMVAGGMGVTLLPRLASEGVAAAGAAITVRPFSTPVIGRSIGIAWRAGAPRANECRMIADALRAIVSQSANRAP